MNIRGHLYAAFKHVFSLWLGMDFQRNLLIHIAPVALVSWNQFMCAELFKDTFTTWRGNLHVWNVEETYLFNLC